MMKRLLFLLLIPTLTLGALNTGTLIPGSGVTIADSPSGVTISATGSGGTVTSVSGTTNEIAVATGTTTPVVSIVSNPVIPGLTNSQAVITDGSGALHSLAYTNANTPSTLVERDSSGNFSAGTITASLSGTSTNATNVATTSTSSNSVYYLTFVGATSGNNGINVNSNLQYDPGIGGGAELTTPHILPGSGNSYSLGLSGDVWANIFSNKGTFGGTTNDSNSLKVSSTTGTVFNVDTNAPRVTFAGGQIVNRTPVSANYGILTTDYIVAYTSTSSAYTATLPNVSNATGNIIIVKDESGGANVNNITINTTGGVNIDGFSSVVINQSYGSYTFYSNGTQWFII